MTAKEQYYPWYHRLLHIISNDSSEVRKFATFTIASISITVNGLDKILRELDKATDQFIIADLLWLLGKFLSEKNIRQILIQDNGITELIEQLIKRIV